MGLLSWLKNLRKPKKITLGIALGSGGAKGYAELGALKAFEENGIEFDVIAGTSIGSVVGAFYADGYSVTDICELLRRVNFDEIISTLMLNMNTLGMERVVDRTIGHKNIEELKKPFRCVATDVVTGEEKVFDKGKVSSALCASSAYPPFFRAVEIDGGKYIDGAFTNSVPSDVVRDMGADYVIGIDLRNNESKTGFISRIIPSYESKVKEPWKKGYENSDFILHPDLKDFKPTSFRLWEIMFDIGYREASEKMPEIKADIERVTKNHKKKRK